jgi:predicted amidohydrolase
MRLAVVQPVIHRPPDDHENVDEAVRFVSAAAAQGADLVVFPETYPGPWRMPRQFDPAPELCKAAADNGIYVVYGSIEPLDDGDPDSKAAYNVIALAEPGRDEPQIYRRTHPPGPWAYKDGPAIGVEWDFDYVAGDELPVFETAHGTIGLAMCSEVYVPEVSRVLALRGAELILLPAGTEKGPLWETWRHLIWARAIENLAYTATTQNLFFREERGLAMVAAPEAVVLESTEPGVFLAEVDLERVRTLRDRVDPPDAALGAKVKPGMLDQWYRPEVTSPA